MTLDPRKVAVLASGEGTNLAALLDKVHGVEGCSIVAVAVSKPGVPAITKASSAGIEARVFAKADYADRKARDDEMADWLTDRGAGMVVTAGWMELLTPAFLSRFPDRVVNVHPSLLPEFPGIDAVGQAVAAGAARIGVTVHLVDEGIDTGRVLLQEGIDVPAGLGREQALALLRPLEHQLLPQAVLELARRAGYISFGGS
jgi:phosphoribosylglycinamide formyltransferase 1